MVLVAAVVAEKAGRTVIDGQNNVEVSVTVDIRIGSTSADDRLEQVISRIFRSDELEEVLPWLTGIPEKLHRLCVGFASLHLGDIGLQMAVGREQIKSAIQIIVKEKEPELQRWLSRRTQSKKIGEV